MNLLTELLLGGLSLLAISLQRTYSRIPVKELKRRAREGDEFAAALYNAASYGYSLRFILWFLVALTSAVFFVFVARNSPFWFALIASCGLIWLGFVWIPLNHMPTFMLKLAKVAAPPLTWLVSTLHPLIDFFGKHLPGHGSREQHTGMYEKADLLDLLDRQEQQTDNRINRGDMEIARGALMFGDRLVGDVMTPRRVVKAVAADDDLGPILMNELHDSGHSRFPVHNDKEDNVVGTLYLRDLVGAKTGGKVRDKMLNKVLYLHEDQSLHDALQAILKTRHHMYIVVNSFEEYVGIITMEDVLEQIIGEQIMDEFDEYEDLRVVAKHMAEKEHTKHISRQPNNVAVDEEIEVE